MDTRKLIIIGIVAIVGLNLLSEGNGESSGSGNFEQKVIEAIKNNPDAIKTALKGKKYGFLTSSQVNLADYGLSTAQKAKLIELENYFGREYWLSFHNFDVIKRYNPSDLYAMAVYQLSYYISMLKGKPTHD